MDKPPGDAASIFEMARHFHAISGVPIADTPSQLSPARIVARVEWLREEVNELESATTLVDQVDAVVDVIYVALGALVEMGVELEKPLQVIHESNLAKVWPDGSFHKTSTGKIIKPSGWTPPNETLNLILRGSTRSPSPKNLSSSLPKNINSRDCPLFKNVDSI